MSVKSDMLRFVFDPTQKNGLALDRGKGTPPRPECGLQDISHCILHAMGSIYRLKGVKTSNEAVYRFLTPQQCCGSNGIRKKQEAQTQQEFPIRRPEKQKPRVAATTRGLM